VAGPDCVNYISGRRQSQAGQLQVSAATLDHAEGSTTAKDAFELFHAEKD
jgi:hypothetical protein